MSGHEQYGEDLALYALGSLEGDARMNLEKHLDTCGGCRQELEALRGDTALLAASTLGPKPPQRSRQRLLDAIAKQSHVPATVPAAATRFNWRIALGWVAAAAMLLVALQLRKANQALQGAVASLGSVVGQQTVELADAQRAIEAITSEDAQRIVLVGGKNPPTPQGKAFYLREKSGLVFVANNLAPLPPDKIYELWLIPPSGPPIAAGLFKPDAKGNATVINPSGLPAGVEAKTFSVTLEPASGPHDAPRGTGVMAGGA
jgi:anti-sigma-K factor RskA